VGFKIRFCEFPKETFRIKKLLRGSGWGGREATDQDTAHGRGAKRVGKQCFSMKGSQFELKLTAQLRPARMSNRTAWSNFAPIFCVSIAFFKFTF
jgi:hypothetical protein